MLEFHTEHLAIPVLGSRRGHRSLAVLGSRRGRLSLAVLESRRGRLSLAALGFRREHPSLVVLGSHRHFRLDFGLLLAHSFHLPPDQSFRLSQCTSTNSGDRTLIGAMIWQEGESLGPRRNCAAERLPHKTTSKCSTSSYQLGPNCSKNQASSRTRLEARCERRSDASPTANRAKPAAKPVLPRSASTTRLTRSCSK